jgi:CHAT domain-containing protein
MILRSEISKAYSFTKEEQENRGINLALLEYSANEIEKELSLKSEKYKSELSSRESDWKEIQNILNENEVAVEYINVKDYKQGKINYVYYCALIIRKGYQYPELVVLCKEKELESCLLEPAEKMNSYVRNPEYSLALYNIIWKPLEKYLSGANNIYISPSGLINKISLSALAISEDELLCDKYSLHYLGNLKDIVIKKNENINLKEFPDFKLAVFGGADYDLDSAGMAVNLNKYKTGEKKNVYFDINDTIKDVYNRGLDLRGGKWSYLNGTLTEAEEIKKIFVKNGLKTEEYIKSDASEDAIKSLSRTNNRNSPTVLHISTHGFFFPEPKEDSLGIRFQNIAGSEKIKRSVNPLLRSGLILAGANNFWQSNKNYEGLENGILTAYEVSNMDLQNTELVVLSACETGLGDIKGGEGVYGLQRAFKVAGAKTIIMSLWKVPDKETVELMELFYTNWLSGMTKYDAFTNAQKEMRKKYAPYFWAAFVMVE